MKVWITKYALSRGIIETEGYDDCREVDASGNMISVKEDGREIYFHGEGTEWHRDKQSAIVRAEEMRKKKIASLEKQIAKLQQIEF